MFDDNWESVADHVGSRTREECVLKFLQLEIEDKYLEDSPSANGATTNDTSYLSNGRLPFSQFDNPVMSVMGFLAGLADPATTAAAAGRSVAEMRKTLKSRIEGEATPGAEKEKEKETKQERPDEAMQDVDDTTSLANRSPPPPSTSHDLPTTALSLTAARSAALASHTERQLSAQVSAAVNMQLQKLELKMQQFGEMEALLQAERREVERSRKALFLERLEFRKRVREVEGRLSGISLGAGGEGAERERASMVSAEAKGEVAPVGESEGAVRHEI